MDHTSTALGTKIKKKDIYQGRTCHLCKGYFVTPLPHDDISRSFDSHCTAYKNKNKKNERTKKNVHETKKDV